MQIKTQKYKQISLVSLLALLILLPMLLYSWNNLLSINNQLFSEETPKKAGYWTSSPIFIYENDDWSSKYTSQPWFSGSGSWSDPYVIENLTINGQNSGSCIRIRDSTVYYTIRNCTLYNAGSASNNAGLNIWNADNGLIIGNNCSYNHEDGIWVYMSQNITILNNTANYNEYYGIQVRESINIRVTGNIACNSLIFDGLCFTDSNNVNVTNNICCNNTQVGIRLWGMAGSCYDFKVYDNELRNNYYGIHLENAISNEISDNIIDTSTIGIHFYDGDGNIISDNKISNCTDKGLFCLTGSNNNFFYENYLSDNNVNAEDRGTGNDWNTTIVGNYWDDYGGSDLDDDGIGDTPYNVPGTAGAKDHFPIWDDGLEPIYIDGDATGVGAHNWTWAENQPWCSGLGTFASPYVIEDISVDGRGNGFSISIQNSDVYFEIRNSDLYNAGFTFPDSAIFLNNVGNATIIGNNLTDTNFIGVRMDNSDNNYIIGNDASFAEEGILMTNSEFNHIIGNTINDTSNNGINIDDDSDFNTISSNNIKGTGYGISIFTDSDNNTIEGNTVINNNVGISILDHCINNRILNNHLEDNDAGVAIRNFNSTNNVIYNNTFLLNTVNGEDDSFNINYWNYGLIGNYWDDYGGVDVNDDGIGDSAYVVSGLRGRLDNYPIWDDGFNGSRIHIDDTGFNSYDWEVASKLIWCTGLGTYDDPYTIENIAIDAGNVGSPIFIESSSVYFVIKNCNLTNSQATGVDAGIKFEDVYNGKIFENNITDNYAGVKLIRSDNNSISANYIYDNTGQGIILQQSQYNVIVGNTANNSNYYGLFIVSFSHNNTIEGNTFGNNKGASGYGSGIRISGSNDCEVSGNWLSDNDQGIRITDNSHRNKFYDNVIHNNAKYGVLIQDLTRNCNYSVFYNNSIINLLGINAYDDGLNSEWDNGINGNFWSDYGGADNNGDGIGDTPYLISGDANSQDNYPNWSEGDDISPTISIITPLGGSFFGTHAPTYNLNIFDLYLNISWYTLNNSATRYFFTPTNGINVIAIDETEWDSFSDGFILMIFYVNDSAGNTANISNMIEKDATNPIITLNSPLGGTIFGSDAPEFNLTIFDPLLQNAWYTIVTSVTPHYFSPSNGINIVPIDESSWAFLPEGSITFDFFVNDSVGNIQTIQVTITKDLPSSEPEPAIPFGNYFILFLGIGLVSILFVERKKRIK